MEEAARFVVSTNSSEQGDGGKVYAHSPWFSPSPLPRPPQAHRFRSSVFVEFGSPFYVTRDDLALFKENKRAAVRKSILHIGVGEWVCDCSIL